jgi:hypothetical protein
MFLFLELGQPFQGAIKVPSAPLRYALAHLGQRESAPDLGPAPRAGLRR